MAIYRYIFLLIIFSLLLWLAWLMTPAREQPADILHVSKSEVSALKKAIESENLEDVVHHLPSKLREEAKIVVQSPSFLGKDREGMKWEVTADKAYQERNQTELGLERVVAKRAVDNIKEAVNLAAPQGQFDDATSTLRIKNGFVGTVKDVKVSGKTADYQMLDQKTSGQNFAAKNEKGQLQADSFSANLIAETAEFNGNVRMKIKLKPRAAASQNKTTQEGQ